MAIVYKHIRNDTNKVFYIGIGKDRYRIGRKGNRNDYWHNIVNKHGFSKEIIHADLSWEDACEFEKFYIMLYGRKDLKKGCLVNLTHGGEGKPTKYINNIDFSDKYILKEHLMKFHPRNFTNQNQYKMF